MSLTQEQLKANEDFFNKVASLTNTYIWKEYFFVYKIKDGNFICDSQESYDMMKKHTTLAFHKRIIKDV